MLKKVFWAWSSLAASMSLSVSPATSAEMRVAGLYNIEDIVPVSGTPWLIASSIAGGMRPSGFLVAIDSRDGTFRRLPIHVGDTSADCPEIPIDRFKPHGISIVTDRQDQVLLHVINHGDRESIETFRVSVAPEPRLAWLSCKVLPKGTNANGVAADRAGNIYVTNMGRPIDGGEPVSRLGGEVLTITSRGSWRAVPGSRIAAPNGIVASPEGGYIYVASWTAGELFKVSLTGDNAVKRLKLPMPILPDNLRWGNDGSILVAGQLASVDAVHNCYVSKDMQCSVPSAVAIVDPEHFAVKCMGKVAFNAATVAAPMTDKIWIGTFRGTSVLQMPISELSYPKNK